MLQQITHTQEYLSSTSWSNRLKLKKTKGRKGGETWEELAGGVTITKTVRSSQITNGGREGKDRDRQTDTQTETERRTHIQRDRQTDTHMQTETERYTHIQRDRDRGI